MKSKLLIMGLIIGVIGLYLMLLDSYILDAIGLIIIFIAGALGLKAHEQQ